MSHDAQTYRRAANVALIGLFTQFVLTVLIGVLGLYANAPALHAATWHLLGGLAIWIVLAVLFNQHRLERAEALEAEQLAEADAATAALFDEAGQQLAVARKRLENTQRFGIPIASLLLAIYLLSLGGWMTYTAYQRYQNSDFTGEIDPTANFSLITLLTGVMSFIAFLIARYVAGMTRNDAWTPLRSGAAYLMGNTLVIVGLGVASVFGIADNLDGFGIAALAVPALMVVLGVEIILALILNVYVPRRAGEAVRPAFDSRILGWLTQPESLGKIVSETLNYQLGFEVSRSWFYQLIARWLPWLVAVCVGLVVLASSFVVVGPEENAVITTWGKFERVAKPGLTFKWPWPAGGVERYDVYRVHELVLGSRMEHRNESAAMLWTNEHTEGGEEQFLVIAPTPTLTDDDTVGDIAAGELAGADIIVNYRIADLAQYVSTASHPTDLLRGVAASEVNRAFAAIDIDRLLGKERLTLSETLRQNITAAVEEAQLGIEVTFVSVSSVHPPQASDVATAFHEQIGAFQEKQSRIEEARRESIQTLAQAAGSPERALTISDAIEQLEALRDRAESGGELTAEEQASLAERAADIEALIDAAGGEAAQRILEARAERWRRANRGLGDAERFQSRLQAYNKAPRYYRMNLYLQTLADALKDRRKLIIDGDDTNHATIRIEMKDVESGIDSILNPDQ